MTVTEVHQAAAVLLNDPNQVTWTDSILLGVTKQAYEELCNDLIANGFRLFREVSANLVVTTPGKVFDTPPVDLMYPIKLEERNPGEDDDQWIGMNERDWEPSMVPTTSLRYWAFRKGAVNFVGATLTKEVRMRYMLNTLGTVGSVGSVINMVNAAGLLGAKVASIAAGIAKNPKDSEAKEVLYQDRLVRYIQAELGNQQAVPARRKPYTATSRFRRII